MQKIRRTPPTHNKRQGTGKIILDFRKNIRPAGIIVGAGFTLPAQTQSLNATNLPGGGLGTNWMRVSSSSATDVMNLPINTVNGSGFFRLIYP